MKGVEKMNLAYAGKSLILNPFEIIEAAIMCNTIKNITDNKIGIRC